MFELIKIKDEDSDDVVWRKLWINCWFEYTKMMLAIIGVFRVIEGIIQVIAP